MRFLIALLSLLSLNTFAAAQELGRAETPAWVDELPLLNPDPAIEAQALDGVHYILSDFQIRWNGDLRETYGRTVMKVTDRAGLERAATISFEFDPKLDQMILTRLVIIRDGQEIDLRDTVQAELVRREQRLEEGIIDGTLTAWVQIPDLRVGDIVDHASLRIMQPLIPGGERFGYSTLEWGVPVQLSRTVLYWPEEWTLNVAPVPDRIAYSVAGAPKDGIIRHEWQKVNHLPDRWEDNIPRGFEEEAVLRFSADPDWGALSAALTPYYAADYPLTPEWETKLKAISDASSDPETRAIAALRLVQDELRYVSLSVGAGGIFARLPVEVTTSGFGDCKDKALLLVTLLRRLGIKAEVALTDIDAGQALPLDKPSLGAFDHAIVRIRVGGQEHWVDPTMSHQGGGFATLTPPDYAFALPLAGPGQTALEAIPTSPERAWSTDVTESFQFSALGVLLEVRSVYGGGAADGMRARWATTPVARMSADYLEYYRGRYPGLTMVREMEMTDDRSVNRLEMVERYLLPPAALGGTDLELAFPFSTEDFASNLPDRLPTARRAPLDAGAAAHFRHSVRVRGAPIEFLAPEGEVIENAGFRFEFSGHVPEPGAMDLEWTHARKGKVVTAKDAEAVIRDGGRVYDLTWFTWDLSPEGGATP
jgi:transglutaminase-like putative cysteine protease